MEHQLKWCISTCLLYIHKWLTDSSRGLAQKIREKFAKNLRNICEIFAKYLQNICEIFAKNLQKIREKFAKNLQKICEKSKFMQNSRKIREKFENFEWILIFRKFFTNFSQIFREIFATDHVKSPLDEYSTCVKYIVQINCYNRYTHFWLVSMFLKDIFGKKWQKPLSFKYTDPYETCELKLDIEDRGI